mmetsp:Transcript_9362/g.29756  ORF Transcript_9362/g.29756 Transcript_9362/m.29756 type:complete len:98 (+) Transcript_9362:92-385(+)
MLGKLSEVDGRLRETFRALCDDGDASLEYASTPAVLFEEGVSIRARPPQSEWSHFEELSGGQKALVAVALQLALLIAARRQTAGGGTIDGTGGCSRV